MSLKGFDGIIESIRQDANTVHEAVLHDASVQGQKVYEDMIAASKQHIDHQLALNEQEVRSTYQREIRQAEKEIQRELVMVKQAYVQTLLDSSLEALEAMDDASFMKLLNRVLEKENGGQRPRIYVDAKRYAYVLDGIGSEFQVIEEPNIQSGFVLSYEDYDIDFEFKHIFQYRKDDLTKNALIRLFEDTDHV